MGIPVDKNAERRLFCLFVCASLYFLTVDVLADVRVLALAGDAAVIPVHLMYLLFQCAGFLLFSVFDSFCTTKGLGAWPTVGLCAVSGACLMAFLLAANVIVAITCIDLCLLTSGMIGAFAYCQVAMGLGTSTRLGRFCGLAIAAAAVLQILVIATPLPDMGRAGMLLLALCAVSVCVLAKDGAQSAHPAPPSQTASAPADVPTGRTSTRRDLVILLAAVALISLVGGLNDGILTRMNADGQIALYAVPRLFYLIGAVAAGFVADYREGRFLGMFILVAMICSTAGLLFLDDPTMLLVNACFYSLLAGFSIIFFTVPFMRLAIRMARPSLWAGMGRAVRLPFLALGTALMEYLLNDLPFTVTMCLSAALCAILIILFSAGNMLPNTDAKVTERATAPSGADALARFGRSHGLTSREQEILLLLYRGYATPEIAERLFISEKTVRNHISNMMAKANVASRTELLVHALEEDGPNTR